MHIQYKLRENVDLYESDNGVTIVCKATGKTQSVTGQIVTIAKGLQSGWLAEDEAVEQVDDLTHGYFGLIRMQKAGVLDARIMKGNSVLFSVSPAPQDSAFKSTGDSGTTYQLNRYAYLRQEQGALLLESPLTSSRITVHDAKLAGMLHQLCAGLCLDIASDEAKIFLSVLIALEIAEPAGTRKENDPMDFWQFHDLLYYARSLTGKSTYPIGGTPPPRNSKGFSSSRSSRPSSFAATLSSL